MLFISKCLLLGTVNRIYVLSFSIFQVDATLCNKSYVYSSFRKKGSIGEMQVHIMQPGCFRELREFVIQNTTGSPNQFKVPRVLKRKDVVEFMFQRVVKN